MNDMTKVIVPKSDQLGADDLLAGPRTIRIRDVTIRPGTEQPVSIFFDGDDGKPWKCCKSMSRILVAAWGPDANEYIGRHATLFRDPNVTWAGMKVGGIRISHLSHIESDLVMALTATKGSKKLCTVKPLMIRDEPARTSKPRQTAQEWLADFRTKVAATSNTEELTDLHVASEKALKRLQEREPALYDDATAAMNERAASFGGDG